jgi:O-antigen ligase
VWDLIAAASKADPLSAFIDGRLATPMSYPNAGCALFLSAAIPATILAGRREVPPLGQAAFLGAAGMLAQLALLCESRASLVALPLTVVVALALGPGRLRLLVPLAAVTIATAATAQPLLNVFSAVIGNDHVSEAVRHSARIVVWTGLGLAAVGLLIAVVDEYVSRRPGASRILRRTGLVLVVALVVTGAAVALPRIGNPRDRVVSLWTDFKSDHYTEAPGTPHFTSGVGSSRYGIWVVAVREIERHPFFGVGADNFAADYLRERHNLENPLYPHSVELRTQAQLGIVGSLLLLTFLGAAGAAVVRTVRRTSGGAGSVSAACALVFVYWLLHGSVDWFWEVPALGGAAFAFLGLATAVEAGEQDAPVTRGRIAVVVAALAAVFLIAGLPWASAREINAAASSWYLNPQKALDRLAIARRLNPFTPDADITEGVIAARMSDDALLTASFRRALGRDPHNWYAMLEIGAAASRAGNDSQAQVWIARAHRTDPLEPAIIFAQRRLAAHRPITTAQIEQILASAPDAVQLSGRSQK